MMGCVEYEGTHSGERELAQSRKLEPQLGKKDNLIVEREQEKQLESGHIQGELIKLLTVLKIVGAGFLTIREARDKYGEGENQNEPCDTGQKWRYWGELMVCNIHNWTQNQKCKVCVYIHKNIYTYIHIFPISVH